MEEIRRTGGTLPWVSFALSLAVLLLTAACRSRQAETRFVVVTATPVPIAVAPIAPVEEPTPTQPMQSAEFAFPVAQPTEMPSALPTPADVRESAFEPRKAPTPDSLHEQMKQCLVLSAQNDPVGGALEGAARVRVKAKNVCSVEFAWSDIWVEVRAMPRVGSGTVAREIGRLYSGVPPLGEAEGYLVVVGPSDGQFFRYEASLWWASGGGRKPE